MRYMPVNYFVQDPRNFKQRAVGITPDVVPNFLQRGWLQKLVNTSSNVAKIAKHDPHAFFAHPLGVVSLLRHGLLISLDYHRQPELQGLADAARARLSDEEIRQ